MHHNECKADIKHIGCIFCSPCFEFQRTFSFRLLSSMYARCNSSGRQCMLGDCARCRCLLVLLFVASSALCLVARSITQHSERGRPVSEVECCAMHRSEACSRCMIVVMVTDFAVICCSRDVHFDDGFLRVAS